jgi:hypothetical protein
MLSLALMIDYTKTTAYVTIENNDLPASINNPGFA